MPPARKNQALSNKQGSDRAGLRAQRKADADFVPPLCHRVREDPVDADDRDRQGHCRGNAEQRDGERCASYGSPVRILKRPNLGQRHTRADPMNGGRDLLDERLAAGAAATNRERNRAPHG